VPAFLLDVCLGALCASAAAFVPSKKFFQKIPEFRKTRTKLSPFG
jgi:hypothetical protein